ncbi:MAG TPA: hypothetical protein VIB39_11895 [Candidatus Angelobacter sp.]|jgi:hypothetical protein
MESAVPSQPNAGNPSSYKASTIAMAIIVTLAVLISIVAQWKIFSFVQKVIAIALMLNLSRGPVIGLPWLFRRWTRESKKSIWESDPDQIAQAGYICLLLVIMLFAR